jgi:putative CocE/NonD family hydrolase
VPAGSEQAEHFRYDPADPVPTHGGRLLARRAGPVDRRPVEDREDVLVFTSDPLSSPVEATGRVSLVLHASSTAVDTDFVAALVDVHPDGYAELLADGIVRARFRDSLSRPTMMVAGEVYEFRIDLWSISHLFGSGHRIRVEVTSSSFPRWNRNLNTGLSLLTECTPVIAEQTVHHDELRPSRLLLPVVARRTGRST